MLNVKLISMNYENVCGYLCFCCADAVDCGGDVPRPVDSRAGGNDGLKDYEDFQDWNDAVHRSMDTALKPV